MMNCVSHYRPIDLTATELFALDKARPETYD